MDLPEALRDGIVAWGGQELVDPALRTVPRESLHLTLAFLGYMPERDIGQLEDVVGGVEAPAPLIRLGDPIAKPSPKAPRLFALPVDSPGTFTLQAALEEVLVSRRLYRPEKRPFWPHVTVARVKAESGRSRRPRRVRRLPARLSDELLASARGVRVTLYRSELQPQGARYTPLAQVELSEDGRQ